MYANHVPLRKWTGLGRRTPEMEWGADLDAEFSWGTPSRAKISSCVPCLQPCGVEVQKLNGDVGI
jgi:hypothetical protein